MLGRCAGCGEQATLRYVLTHQLTCQPYADLYRDGKASSPAEEYEAHQREVTDPQYRDKVRLQRWLKVSAEQDRKREWQAERWKKPSDPFALDEDEDYRDSPKFNQEGDS